jgi:hypothetical protein
MRNALSPVALSLALLALAGGTACSMFGSHDTVTELHAGSKCAGATTDTEGPFSITHFWTVELTQKDAVFTFDDRRVVLEDVVGKSPLVCRGNQASGKRPDVVLELGGGREARWKGYTIDVDGKHYDIEGPGTFMIDSSGTMKRRSGL